MNKNIPEAIALQFLIDSGVEEPWMDDPVDRYALGQAPLSSPQQSAGSAVSAGMGAGPQMDSQVSAAQAAAQASTQATKAGASVGALIGASEARAQAAALARDAKTLDELRAAIAEFDGLDLKKTAMNMVFSDGNPQSVLMVIGDAPMAEDDRSAKPFSGQSGDLLDKILGCIDIARDAEDIKLSAYLTNMINWRPPGNRTPAPGEIEVSLPFIERHIQLAAPKVLLLGGGEVGKALLNSSDSMSRLRKNWHIYKTITPELQNEAVEIPALVTFHPSYLLKTPAQKRGAWADILMVREKLAAL